MACELAATRVFAIATDPPEGFASASFTARLHMLLSDRTIPIRPFGWFAVVRCGTGEQTAYVKALLHLAGCAGLVPELAVVPLPFYGVLALRRNPRGAASVLGWLAVLSTLALFSLCRGNGEALWIASFVLCLFSTYLYCVTDRRRRYDYAYWNYGLSLVRRIHADVAILREAGHQLLNARETAEVADLLAVYSQRLVPESDGASCWMFAECDHRPQLVAKETTLGAVVTARPEAPFSADQLWAAELLAGLAGLQLQALQARDREVRVIGEVTGLVDLIERRPHQAAHPDPLEQFAAQLQSMAGAQAFLTFWVQAGGTLRPGASRGVDPAAGVGEAVTAHIESCEIFAGSQKIICCTASCLSDSALDIARSIDLRQLVCVPVSSSDGTALAVVVLLHVGSQPKPITPELTALWETYARYAGVALHNFSLYETMRMQSQKLRQLFGQVVDAQEAERRRIARDLHDWVVQGMAAPSFQIQLAAQLVETDPAGARAEIAAAVDQLTRASEELRRIMKGLRPYLLDELGLYRALQAYASEWSYTTGIPCTLKKDPGAKLPPGSTQCLAAFRIVQEALNNVAKHSGATVVRITITRRDDRVLIRVRDNGKGLTLAEKTAGGAGLLGMQERAGMLGGSVVITSPPTGGCLVTCSIPVLV